MVEWIYVRVIFWLSLSHLCKVPNKQLKPKINFGIKGAYRLKNRKTSNLQLQNNVGKLKTEGFIFLGKLKKPKLKVQALSLIFFLNWNQRLHLKTITNQH